MPARNCSFVSAVQPRARALRRQARQRALVAALVVVGTAACHKDNATELGVLPGTVPVFIQVYTNTGKFSLTFAGQTISSVGDYRYNVPPGV
jgi:hypothetical protein